MWHGCTHIAGLYPDRSVQEDFLTYGADLIADLGFDTIKLELSIAFNTTKYPGQAFGSPGTLKELAEETAFDTVFSDARFNRYLLTCFSIQHPGDNPWAGAWTKSNGDDQETEMYDLALHLAETYPTKEFIIQNWEGDWQLLNSFVPSTEQREAWINAYIDYTRRRQNAIHRAMREVAPGSGRVYYALECNRVLDDYGIRIHRDVAPIVKPDILSFSSYETIEGWTEAGGSITDQSEIEDDIVEKMTRMKLLTEMAGLPRGTPMILGEYGFPQEAPYFPGTLDAVGMLATVIDTAEALGFAGEVYWQGLSNEQYAEGSPRGFNLWERDGNSDEVGPLNALGEYYRDNVL